MKRTSTLFSIFAIAFTLFIAVIAIWLVSIRPWQSKVLTHGFSPDGREYCIVQTFKGFTEPYQVSFYLRDSKEIWHWNYLAHEDFGWNNAAVTFSEGSVFIKRNGEAFKEIHVPNQNAYLITTFSPNSDEYCPSDFSVDDVLSFHNRKFDE